jgi:histone H3/H4
MLIQFKPNYDHQRVKQEDSHPGFIRDGGKRLEH